MDLVEEYYRKNIEGTDDLFHFTLCEGYLLFYREDERRMRIMMDWNVDNRILTP